MAARVNPLGWLFGFMLIIPVIWFIIGILIAVWIYRDAESRGMSGALWLLIALIGGIVGLIVYLLVRKPLAPPATPMPSTPQQRPARYCKSCGSPLPADSRFCPRCGREQT